jgi:cob(II)yrinic acid a,c-diamide reductase (EC 1.16.8.1)
MNLLMKKKEDSIRQFIQEEMLDHTSYQNQLKKRNYLKFSMQHIMHHRVGFSQPWNFILIKDQETKKKIKESFEEERKRSSQIVEEPKNQNTYHLS